MSRDTVLVAEDKKRGNQRWSLDNLSTQHWLDGHVPGAERAIAWLKARAVELFQEGKDDQAKLLRDTANKMQNDLIPELKSKAAEHKKEYPSVLNGAARG